MKIDLSNLESINAYSIGRFTERCEIWQGDKFLWLESTYFPWSPFKQVSTNALLIQFNAPKDLIEKYAGKYGAEFEEHPYGENGLGYPIFSITNENTDKLVEFLESEDYGKLSEFLFPEVPKEVRETNCESSISNQKFSHL